MAKVRSLERVFSPNGDGTRDVVEFQVTLREAGRIAVDVVDEDGDAVRRLADGARVTPPSPLPLRWNGRTDAGTRAPDGRYRVRVTLRQEGRSVVPPRATVVDTVPPRPRVRSIVPGPIVGPAPGAAPDRRPRRAGPAAEERPHRAHRRRRAARGGRAPVGAGHAHAHLERAHRRAAGSAWDLPRAGRVARPRGQPRPRTGRAPAPARPVARAAGDHRPRDRRRAAGAAGGREAAGARERRRPPPPVPLAPAPRRHTPSGAARP